MNLNVSVLGAGSFGTTMAHLVSHNAPTLLWCRREETAEFKPSILAIRRSICTI